ncbi:MAG TPA: LysM peptidoglycan-binding domain-containing protein [Enhygromyxa sp.]|nr:LysM peptidoglycan-binding domain-containing protein [Enhygromyxa sp.]
MDPLTPPDSHGRVAREVVTLESHERGLAVALQRKRKRIWRCAATALIGLAVLISSVAIAGPPQPGKVQIGPSWDPDRAVWADDEARQRVRGDRPPSASIHVAYATPERRWDHELRRELLGFEATAFPEGQAPRKTIVDKPPEAWMAKLELPDIPVRWNHQTIEYLRFFKDDPKGQRMIAAWLNRMGRYEQRLRAILAEVGVPQDLVYVAMIESGFDPSAQSSVGAAGMWQFMEPTGRVYGLDTDYWVDDRLDFERSGYAAATYLADLKTRFGTWELALAAYNAGYGLVVQSIRANNTNNYWALTEIENALPRQTVNYVPKILAAAIVGHNREAFGVTGKPEPRLDLIEVKVAAGTRLEDLAKAIEVDVDLLAQINAAYLRGRTPPEGGPAPVRIPRAKHELFSSLTTIASNEQRWTTYKAKLGDDLDSIAAAHGITQKQLRKINAIHDSGEVKAGVVLVVPAQSAAQTASTPSSPPIVAVPPLAIPAGKRLVFFRVTRASSGVAIASSFGVAWTEIVGWNDLDPEARLVDGQMLQILVAQDFDAAAAGVTIAELADVRHVVRGSAAHLDALLADRELLRRGYKVGKDDTLKKIAKKFDLSLGSLARINGVPREHKLAPDQIIVVYVAKGASKGTVDPPAPRPTTLTAEIEVATSLESSERETDTELPSRRPSTPDSSRVPGKSYDDQ